MTVTLPKVIADFTTTLVNSVAVGDTTATLTSATDQDGVALPTGLYGFTVDRKNSQKEYYQCTLNGTSLTNIRTVTRGTAVSTAGFARSHRKGAEVIISDWFVLKRIVDLLDGTTGFDSAVPIKYDAHPTFNADTQIVDKKYVDDAMSSGGVDASSTVKGITKLSIDPVSPTDPIAVGDNDTRVPTQGENDALVGNNTDIAVGSSNTFVTQTGLQHNEEKYAADAGSDDTYVITLSPAPTSYTNGMVVYFKANTVNTGAATLNVNGLGAKTIVKHINTTLTDGDILAGQLCTVIYDGTNFVLQSPTAVNVNNHYQTGVISDLSTTAAGDNDVTVSTNFTPAIIKLHYFIQGNDFASGGNGYIAEKGTAIFNGTTLISKNVIWRAEAGQLTADNGVPNTLNVFTNVPNSTSALSVGVSGGGVAIQLVLSIQSVSSTGFTIRRQTSVSSPSATARCKIAYEVLT